MSCFNGKFAIFRGKYQIEKWRRNGELSLSLVEVVLVVNECDNLCYSNQIHTVLIFHNTAALISNLMGKK